jgi:predicted acetyltransferase
MAITVRTGSADDFETVMRLMNSVFHDSLDEPKFTDTDRELFEPERSLVAVDGDEVVGHAGSFLRELSVPGAVVQAAFVTMVGVLGTHRRKGIAKELLIRQLREVRAAGEPVAILWASEGKIYQRFGYGLATHRWSLDIDPREVRLSPPREAEPREAEPREAESAIRGGAPRDLLDDMVTVYDAVREQMPGYAGRTKHWWDNVIADPAHRRHGAGPARAIVHNGPSGPDGYALFATKQRWDDGGPAGEVHVRQVVAANPLAYQEIWRFLLDIDLTRSVSLWSAADGEPLLYMVNEPRRLGTRLSDGLWLRVTDVPGALAARRYGAPVDLVLEVDDPILTENTGRVRITELRDGAHCVPTADPADLKLDVSALGALYLGGASAGALAAAGRLHELRNGAVAEAHAAFGWHRGPAAIEMF